MAAPTIPTDTNQTGNWVTPTSQWSPSKKRKPVKSTAAIRPQPSLLQPSEVASTSEGPAEPECTARCLICRRRHVTGAADCRDKYWKPIKLRFPLTNIE
ncbi:hypothetical protein HPB52_010471 [Rhipicephalus sanguineus]|uniref:Uncharacterized protein n=1 Tax=Rhipicephalus sanguineus TaxID=34632 RepID=A0A9D4PVK1_RHISA|nr:hypothetical protein HPB52_010471 [Rhipicephalus sanguineus]